MKSIYLIGALKNWEIPAIANEIQELGIEAFCDWISPGPDADKFLLQLAKARGWDYEQLLNSHAANHCFQFDKENLDRVDAAVAIAPFGKSAFAELGYMAGKGKPVYVLFPNGPELPERFDLMIKFATKVFFNKQTFYDHLKTKQQTDAILYDRTFLDMLARNISLPVRTNVNRQFFQYEPIKPGQIIECKGDPSKLDLTDPATQWSLSQPKRCPKTHRWAFGQVSQCQFNEGHSVYPNDSSGHKFSVQDAK